MSALTMPCPICGSQTQALGELRGAYFKTDFRFRRCPECRFTFVENPSTDFARIYDEKYYRGEGADASLDYLNELEHPEESVRVYEWRGVLKAVNALRPLNAETQWLDFGCGNGGVVRYARDHSPCRACGFEEGWIADQARGKGIPILQRGDLAGQAGQFDVVTAIEVLEHVTDPVACLKEIRALLKPGGLLFFTTGNARPFRENFFKWGYVLPEIHISYFEPETLERALKAAGFRSAYPRSNPGINDIIRFKILKKFGWRKHALSEKLLPWPLLSRLAAWRFKIGVHPIAWAV